MKKISKMMADLDLCMLTTVRARGITASRPMSTNGDVKYDGTSYIFTYMKSKTVKDIKKNKNVSMAFSGSKLFKHLYISISGSANLIQDREKMENHWNKDLEIWFEKGLDTPGVVMIEVVAKHIKYWYGKEQEEISV